MRILHLLSSNIFSGAENVACQIIEMFDSNPDYELAYCSPKGQISEALRLKNIHYYPMDKISVFEISKVVSLFNPDIIHAHDYRASILSANITTKAKIISHIHHNNPWGNKLCFKTIAYLYSSYRIKKILTVSEVIMNEFVFGDKLKKKVSMVGNPFDSDIIKKKAEIRNDVPETDLVFIGRFVKEKNPLEFVQIVKILKRENCSLRAIMIGDGELFDDVKVKIKNENLSENILLTGFINNPYPYIKKSKIMCVTSLWEGFGLVALEGMALGIPVLAPRVGGLVDILDEDMNCFCSGINEYVFHIKELLQDRNKYMDTCEKCRNKADKYSLEDYKEKIQKAYESVFLK